jgi:large subunit ribosomal protein L19
MSSSLLQSVESFEPNTNIPEIRPGDSVRVHVRIVEGSTERIQVFQGIILRMHKGRGINGTFTVRRIASGGVGVERTFMYASPRVEKVEVVQRAHVRRAQLYFLRDRRGKAARLKEKRQQ